jgi:hypothetical protein
MCQRVYAIFGKCQEKHEQNGEDALKMKHVARCGDAIRDGTTCPQHTWEDVHVLQEDEPNEECPECKGQTPPQTP